MLVAEVPNVIGVEAGTFPADSQIINGADAVGPK